jgi:hypothetical protein
MDELFLNYKIVHLDLVNNGDQYPNCEFLVVSSQCYKLLSLLLLL